MGGDEGLENVKRAALWRLLVFAISFQITIFTQQLQPANSMISGKSVVISFQITIFTQQLQHIQQISIHHHCCD